MSTRDEQKRWLEETEWVTWEGSKDSMAVAFKGKEPEVQRSMYDVWSDMEVAGHRPGSDYDAPNYAEPQPGQLRNRIPRVPVVDSRTDNPFAWPGRVFIGHGGGAGPWAEVSGVESVELAWRPHLPDLPPLGGLRPFPSPAVELVPMGEFYRLACERFTEAMRPMIELMCQQVRSFYTWWQENADLTGAPRAQPKAKRKPQRVCPRHGELASRCRACWRHR